MTLAEYGEKRLFMNAAYKCSLILLQMFNFVGAWCVEPK